MPLHTIRADIDYACVESQTLYGTIGVKVWIHKGDFVEEEVQEEAKSQRTKAQKDRYKGTQAHRHKGTEAQRGKGVKEQAQRHKVTEKKVGTEEAPRGKGTKEEAQKRKVTKAQSKKSTRAPEHMSTRTQVTGTPEHK